LTSAGFELLLPDDPDLVAYRRGDVVVILNMSDHERRVPADLVVGHRLLVSSVADDASTDQASTDQAGTGHQHIDSIGPDAAVWFGR
jgi:hypothetical protein